MGYTRPRSRGKAAFSRQRRSHKISPIERGVLRVHNGLENVDTTVPVVDMVEAVERLYVPFDHFNRRVGRFDGYREALRAGPSRERTS
jgi:hypothetical protein